MGLIYTHYYNLEYIGYGDLLHSPGKFTQYWVVIYGKRIWKGMYVCVKRNHFTVEQKVTQHGK